MICSGVFRGGELRRAWAGRAAALRGGDCEAEIPFEFPSRKPVIVSEGGGRYRSDEKGG